VLRLVVLVLCLPAVCAAQPLASGSPAPLSRDWKRITSENFIAVGDAGEAQLRDALVQLERFRTALVSLFPRTQLTSPVPTVLVLFKHPTAMARRAGTGSNVAGYFARRPHVNRMVTAVFPDRDEMFNVLQHEYTHYVLHLSGRQIPTWIDEGLAEFYGTFRLLDKTSGVLGNVPSWRLRTLASGDYSLRFEQLFTAEGVSRTFQSPMQQQRFYSSAWALVHYMVVGDRAGQLARYLGAIDRGLQPQDAFKDAFKVEFSKLQEELTAYLHRRRLPALRVPFSTTLAETSPMAPLTEVDALQLQAELLLDSGEDDEAEPLLKKALQLDARHVNARRTLGALQWQRRQWDDAVATMRALAADAPKDFGVQYWLASYLNELGQRDDAMRAADAAATLNSASPDAWVALSIAAMGLGRAGQANTAMANAQMIYRNPALYRDRAHALWWTGDHAGVARDVETFVSEAGWGNEQAQYAAFLGALAHRRLGDTTKATALLAGAATGSDPETWTARVAQFLRGELQAERFLDRASGRGEQTEAHAYIGLMASIAGRRDEARLHLEWVRDRGSRSYTEYDLAVAELRRLSATN
jgi:tetratricopeptide (TPR) repeat protein